MKKDPYEIAQNATVVQHALCSYRHDVDFTPAVKARPAPIYTGTRGVMESKGPVSPNDYNYYESDSYHSNLNFARHIVSFL